MCHMRCWYVMDKSLSSFKIQYGHVIAHKFYFIFTMQPMQEPTNRLKDRWNVQSVVLVDTVQTLQMQEHVMVAMLLVQLEHLIM